MKWLSRKLLVTVLSAVLVPLLSAWGVPPEVTAWIAKIALGYLGAQGTIDAVTAIKTAPK